MVKQRSSRFVWITLAGLVAATLTGVVTAKQPNERAAVGPLDGKAFIGEMGRSGRDSGRTDEFVFDGGKFRASSFSKYGFTDATYVCDEIDGELRFTVAAVSNRSNGGKVEWTGTLRGDVLEGTVRWDHGWESKTYWFRGRAATTTLNAGR